MEMKQLVHFFWDSVLLLAQMPPVSSKPEEGDYVGRFYYAALVTTQRKCAQFSDPEHVTSSM